MENYDDDDDDDENDTKHEQTHQQQEQQQGKERNVDRNSQNRNNNHRHNSRRKQRRNNATKNLMARTLMRTKYVEYIIIFGLGFTCSWLWKNIQQTHSIMSGWLSMAEQPVSSSSSFSSSISPTTGGTTTTETTPPNDDRRTDEQTDNHATTTNTNIDNYINNNNQGRSQKSIIHFVLIVGLEGTGHHLMEEIGKNSPTMKLLKEWNIHPRLTSTLQSQFFDNSNPTNGLWNAHCHVESDIKKKKKNINNNNNNNNNKSPLLEDYYRFNITRLQSKVVKTMQQIEQIAISESSKHNVAMDTNPNPNTNTNTSTTRTTPTSHDQIYFPFNTMIAPPITGMTSGLLSYPNFGGSCRKLNGPNLDLFYKTCQLANVDCSHIYLHRNYIDILYSTTIKRNFNDKVGLLSAIHMYTIWYHVLSNQFNMYKSNTLACIRFYDEINENDKNNGGIIIEDFRNDNGAADHHRLNDNWREVVKRIWGFENNNRVQQELQVSLSSSSSSPSTQFAFDEYIQKIYRPPKPNIKTNAKTFSSSSSSSPFPFINYEPYLHAMMIANERTLQICKQNVVAFATTY